MLICASEVSSEQTLRATVCVVGSGPSGLVLTRRLVEAGVDVLVLEAGPLHLKSGKAIGDRPPLPIEFCGQPKNARPTIAQQVGGTSALWDGVLGTLDPIDFRRRSWIPNSGWPISAEDLESFYKEAALYFGLLNTEFFNLSALPPHLRALLGAMPFDRTLLKNKIFLRPEPPKRFRDDAVGYLTRSGRAQLVYNARAVELVTATNAAVVSAVLFLGPDGSRKSVEAEHVVLSGGAYQNPRLLLNSRTAWVNGIGNQLGLVGRYLADHPRGALYQVRLRTPLKAQIYAELVYRPGQKIKSALRLVEARQEAEGLPNHAFYIWPAFAEDIERRPEQVKRSLRTLRSGNLSAADLRHVAGNAHVLAQIAAYKAYVRRSMRAGSPDISYRIADLLFVCEQVPNPDSRVFLGDRIGPDGYPVAYADWRLCDADFDSVIAMYDLLVGGGLDPHVFEPVHRRTELPWRETLSSAAHHLGTCRMAETASAGVVDRNLKVFGTENVYVCDGSVFPTTGNANPTLTAAALAVRLAAHLAAPVARPCASAMLPTASRLTVAVTGASGFIGRNFIERYAADFRAVRALGRTIPSVPDGANVTRHACRMNDPRTLARAFAGCDAIVHLAYRPASVGWNLAAMRALCGAANEAGVRRIIHMSTMSVYDQSPAGTLIEADGYAKTNDDYSVVKQRLEEKFSRLADLYSLSGVILQPHIVYGWPGEWTGHAADVAKYERALLPDAGGGVCNAVHVDDVSAAIYRSVVASDAILAREAEMPRFLISGPEPITWLEFYTAHAAMLRRLGLPERLRIEPLGSLLCYHDDWKRNLIYRVLYESAAGRLTMPFISLARRSARRRAPGRRSKAALKRLAAPYREGAWQPERLSRIAHQTQYAAHCGRAARVLGYHPMLGLAAGIAATEAAVHRASLASGLGAAANGVDCLSGGIDRQAG